MERPSSDELIREARFRLDTTPQGEEAPAANSPAESDEPSQEEQHTSPAVQPRPAYTAEDSAERPQFSAEAASPGQTYTAEAIREPGPQTYPGTDDRSGGGGLAALWNYRWVVAILVVVGIGLYGIFDSTKSVADIGPGDCFDDPGTSQVSELETKSCDRPHDYEAFAIIEWPGGESASYPGGAELLYWAVDECVPLFEAYTLEDYYTSSLWVETLTPTQESWAEGDREAICVTYRSNDGVDVIPESSSVKAAGA